MPTNYPYLPGVEVDIQDGGLILPDQATTESLLIIAPCSKTDAPTEPTLVRDSTYLKTYFGDFVDASGNVNQAAQAWKAAFDVGCRVIYVMALQGTDTKSQFLSLHDTMFGILQDFAVDHIALVGVFADVEVPTLTSADFTNPDDVVNFPNVDGIMKYAYAATTTNAFTLSTTSSITVDATHNTFNIVESAVTNPITLADAVYDGTTGKTLTDLAAAIKAEITGITSLANFDVVIENGVITILGDIAFSLTAGGTNDILSTLTFTAGAVSMKRHQLGKVYNGNFAKLVSDYSINQTIINNAVIGYIGVTAPASNSLTSVKTYVDTITVKDLTFSGNVSIVTGPELGYSVIGKSDLFYTNGVVTYAGLVSTLSAESAPTNKQVQGVSAVNYNLSLRQLNSLSASKLVTFRMKNGVLVVTDGITTAPDITQGNVTRASDFTRLSTLRITNEAVKLVRQVTDPFVGEPNQLPQRNAMTAAVKSGLEKMKSAGALNDYRFSIVASPQDQILGNAIVSLTLVPAFEMRKITVNVALRPTLS